MPEFVQLIISCAGGFGLGGREAVVKSLGSLGRGSVASLGASSPWGRFGYLRACHGGQCENGRGPGSQIVRYGVLLRYLGRGCKRGLCAARVSRGYPRARAFEREVQYVRPER